MGSPSESGTFELDIVFDHDPDLEDGMPVIDVEESGPGGSFPRGSTPVFDSPIFNKATINSRPGNDVRPRAVSFAPPRVIEDDNGLSKKMDEVLRTGTYQSYCFLNEGKLAQNLRCFQENFLPDAQAVRRRILYAIKANPRPGIAKVLREYGLDGLDCASGPEIMNGINLGFSPGELYFNNPVRTPKDTEAALREGVRYFTAQAPCGINRVIDAIDRAGKINPDTIDIAIRVATQNPNAEIQLSDKFGCTPDEALALLTQNRFFGMQGGLTMHLGSQNADPRSYYKGVELLASIAEKAGGVSSINLGGGFPVNYDKNDRHDIRVHLSAATEAVESFRSMIFGNKEGEVIVEPGRFFVAETVDLAASVIEVSQGTTKAGRQQRRIYMGDGIFTSFSDSKIHGWKYNIQFYAKDGRRASTNLERFALWGRTCDSGDRLPDVWLPSNIEEGDFLWVRNAGAYMDAQGSEFNGFKGPTYISYNRQNL